jgi:class 3 adenylate cyclase/predicted ATPase
MHCPSCQVTNPTGANFCLNCGAALPKVCPSCQEVLPPNAKFCIACGQALTVPPTARRMAPPSLQETERPAEGQGGQAQWAGSPTAERRQLTVLFCDLVGSTALSEQLDPEELRDIVRAYQAVCAEVIRRFDGHIAQYLGDGLLVYFGYPLAHEDDAQRAVRSGLGILDEMWRLNTRLERDKGVRLAVRLGGHTGLVVVGEMGAPGRYELIALGQTPNLAARLQEIAEPNTLLISAATHRLVRGFFACQVLGSRNLKGISRSVSIYQVIGESEAQSRLEVAAGNGLTPLVGREQEIELLLERWQQARDGQGHVVVLSGEAGIGKSRLIRRVRERLAEERHIEWECRCSPYHQHSALYPVIDLLQRMLRLQRDDSPDEKLRKLEEAFSPTTISSSEVIPLLAALLSLPHPERYVLPNFPPERQKRKTLEALLAVVLALASQQPMLFVVEDLHWIDASTLELLSLLIDQCPTTRLLMLLTCRPEFRPPWQPRAHLAQLTIGRLARAHAALMVENVAKGKGLPAEVWEQIMARTDGVPLFVEELTKMVLESNLLRETEDHYELTGPLPALAIPTTLHDSLMARLDRLSTVKVVAQLGSAIGRSFSYELLRAISSLDEEILQRELGRLVEAELLYQRGLPPLATYVFKHALIQEEAYQSLLKGTRQQYHQHIAQALTERFPETAETQPELVAHHYTEAGLIAQAIPYWQRAGEYAAQRSANVEAIAHLTKGLALLEGVPDISERVRQELILQTTLGPALRASRGQGAPEVEQVYMRARELCQEIGEAPQLFDVVRGLWGFYLTRGSFQIADELATQLLSMAKRAGDPTLLLRAHYSLGVTLFWIGEFALSRDHLEQGVTLCNSLPHPSLAFLQGQDLGVTCLSYAAHALWTLGYPNQGLARTQAALTRAQQLPHPFSRAFALNFASRLHQRRREPQAAQEYAEALITLAREHGFVHLIATGTMVHGWAVAEQGQTEDGIALINRGLEAYRGVGSQLGLARDLALLAEAYVHARRMAEGFATLDEAREVMQKTGGRYYEAELDRLKGEFLLRQAAETGFHPPAVMEEAEHSFHQALSVAGSQGAKISGLRAAMSLSRLWHSQGKAVEARALLAGVYGWFTEGFETVDLQEALALLEAWS